MERDALQLNGSDHWVGRSGFVVGVQIGGFVWFWETAKHGVLDGFWVWEYSDTALIPFPLTLFGSGTRPQVPISVLIS